MLDKHYFDLKISELKELISETKKTNFLESLNYFHFEDDDFFPKKKITIKYKMNAYEVDEIKNFINGKCDFLRFCRFAPIFLIRNNFKFQEHEHELIGLID